MPTLRLTIAGAAQFTGLPGAGLFSFFPFNALPRTTRIQIMNISYAADPGGNPGTLFEAFVVRPDIVPTERMIIGRATTTQIVGPAGDGDVRFCGIALPRDDPDPFPFLGLGQFWNIVVRSAGKDVTATVCVDYVVVPYPDTSLEDSQLGGAP